MKRFTVTLMVPQVQIIEADTAQAAHNEVTKMLAHATQGQYPHPTVHSIEQVEEMEIVFDSEIEFD